MDDIEDLAKGVTMDAPRSQARSQIVPKSRKKAKDPAGNESQEKPDCDSYVPGAQAVYLKTWGCAHNR